VVSIYFYVIIITIEFQLFNPLKGVFLKYYGSNGLDHDQFDFSSRIYISTTGKIIVIEMGNNKSTNFPIVN
jgi:hypothetical protein